MKKLYLLFIIPCCLFAGSLDDYLKEAGQNVSEGHCYSKRSSQPDFFRNLLSENPQIAVIGEIGFNAGHSSELFLESSETTEVYSFDIMEHEYAYYGKKYIDEHFPLRHTLVEGDSRESVPVFAAKHPDLKFDLMFIDGGHFFQVALADIINLARFAHDSSILIIDDIDNIQVRRAWQEGVRRGIITRGRIVKDGRREWVVCHYR